ncbi:MAG: hypothetical protein KC636_25170, partial [Myxococcales bacterium]|nr:hypothetical protein [Myxococcales bacterium]
MSIVILRSTMLIVGGPNPTGFIDLAIQANAAMFCRISMLLMARGRFQQAVSVFLGAVLATVGMTAIILEQPILLNTALMLTMFTVLALVIEIPRRALGWGLISILVWLIAQGVRGLLGHGADLEPQFNAVNAVAPVIFLGVITWMLQQNTRHLYATIRVSEQARAEVEEGHRRVALANRKLEDYNTALHSANTQLIEAREAAELANQSKSQFL